MRALWMIPIVGALGLSGCIVAPPQHVVERETVDPYGRVIQRDQYVVDDGPPAPLVEVVPVRPYFGAVWVGGSWHHDRGRWGWHRGYWR